MKDKPFSILPLASALGALVGGASDPANANSVITPDNTSTPIAERTAADRSTLIPNTLVSTGETLLGFVMTEQPDGTLIAQHVSHVSHASHASHVSHASHYSSRY